MLLRSQPLSEEILKKLEAKSKSGIDAMNEDNIKSQYIGHFFDDLFEGMVLLIKKWPNNTPAKIVM